MTNDVIPSAEELMSAACALADTGYFDSPSKIGATVLMLWPAGAIEWHDLMQDPSFVTCILNRCERARGVFADL